MSGQRVVVAVATVAVSVLCASAIALVGGFRLNLTPSEALGLWHIEALQRDVAVGDLVFVCPPSTAPFVEARKRGYLRHGLCPGDFAPLIKTVIALGGQRIDMREGITIDGKPIPSSVVRATDGDGRPVRPFAGGIVPFDYLFLHSAFASSYDSRYFGPVPASGLLGLARPVLTVDP